LPFANFFVYGSAQPGVPSVTQHYQGQTNIELTEGFVINAASDTARRGRALIPPGAVAKGIDSAAKPVRAVGGFFAMSLDTFVAMVRPPFAMREFLTQTWFVARVSLLPTILLSIPFTTLVVFILNVLLVEIGAADYSGSGAAIGTVNQIGPIVTVLVVAGAGATAMCADLGARTIREELDAMRVMGIDPVRALVVPRVLAGTLVALMLSALVTMVGLGGSFGFSVFIQHVTPGAWVAGLTLLVGLADVIIAMVKAALFGLAASLIACFKGTTVGGGPAGVGNAVNETVVYTFMALFAIDVIATAVGVKVSPK
jgi:phospholipid/cholesterol/gamma-HCH transport system permease protein